MTQMIFLGQPYPGIYGPSDDDYEIFLEGPDLTVVPATQYESKPSIPPVTKSISSLLKNARVG